MTDPTNPWLPDWQSMQKQFFSTWTDAARGNTGIGSPFGGGSPIPEGFEAWTRLMGGAQAGNPTLNKVVGSAKQFAEFMQGVVGQLATSKPEMMTPAGMRAALEQAMGGLSKRSNPVLSAFEGITADGARGMEDLYKEFMKAAQPLLAEAKGQMSMPAFGMQREQQERQQALLRSMTEYAEKNSRFQALLYKASRVGLDKFESKMEERSEPGRQITSMRGLYDVFVDAAEEGYAEIALSDEFREAYGEMVNAQMRARQLVQGEVERSTAALGMPSRSELDTVRKRMHDMRRQMADLQERLDAATSNTPRAEAETAKPAPRARAAAPRKAASAKPERVESAAPIAASNGNGTPSPQPAPRAARRKRN